MRTRSNTLLLGILLSLAIGSMACEEAIVPPNRTDAVFTIYGLFNPKSDTQAVRVYTVENLLDITKPEPIDAVVTSVDLTTGETRVWADSLKKFIRGPYAHIFYSPFKAEFEHRYRLEVDRSDGAHVEVTTTVPPLSKPVVKEPDPDIFELIALVLWQNAPNLIDIKVVYYSNAGTLEWDYGDGSERAPGGQLVRIRFRSDTRDIFFEAIRAGISPVRLNRVEISAVVTDVEWVPPDGRFDPEVLVEPGTFSNVEGGFGFVGAGYQTKIIWLPSNEVLDAAGFATQ
ncbi:MAG: hypothetical protein BMS9Abin05_2063 [Rhodothermia bacterium]|nr:MAG: hypothetical protein BMS9Abin05_2063 [Rhodothermia bacterium]